MDHFSSILRKKILGSYLKASRKVIRFYKTQDNPSHNISDLEMHGFDYPVWFLSTSFYVINKGIKFDIPSGFCICFDMELNFFSRILLGKKYPRPIIVLVWFRDVLDYDIQSLKYVVDCVLMNEGFGKFSRALIMLSLRLT